MVRREVEQCSACKGQGGWQVPKDGQYVIRVCRPCDGNGWVYKR